MKIFNFLFFILKIPYDFLKFIILDTIDDIKFIRRLSKNEGGFYKKLFYEIKQISYSDVKSSLKDSWLWIMIVFFAFMCGFYLSSIYYQEKCNSLIIEHFVKSDPMYKIMNPDIDAPYENRTKFVGYNITLLT